MATEIYLKRPNSQIPWGFRIIGGSDSQIPIIISKVIEDSISEEAGLEEDVLLEKINNISTFGLTHSEVNEIILAAENELIFSIRRVNLENLILASLSDENNNSEISKLLRRTIEPEENKINEGFSLKREYGEIINTDSSQNKKKEWSTFLQKPTKPIPKPKNQPSPIPKGELYKVVIKKQKKKDVFEQVQHSEVFQENKEHASDSPIMECNNLLTREVDLEEKIQENLEDNHEETEDEVIQQNIVEDSAEENEEMLEEEAIISLEVETEDIEGNKNEDYENTDNLRIENPIIEAPPSLEEQLAAVQKQLLELAQLPSAIQDSLSEVTQQLANIVGEHKPQTEEEIMYDGDVQESTIITEGMETKQDSSQEEDEIDREIDEIAEIENPQSETLSDICEEEEILEVNEEIIKEDTPDESEDEKTLEKSSQQQMDEETLKKPIVRPIILPGGRKWVDPDDAIIKVKNPKMSDDKICNTIETFSEVICGKTKGINFLKYTPPPKNLEYLQRSDVYRLIHGMEQPVKGISIRSEKILAEEDYYTTE